MRSARPQSPLLRVTVVAVGALSCAPLAGETTGADGGVEVSVVTPGPERPAGCVPGMASAQLRGEERPPAFMLPGTRAAVSVTFDNCSGATWRPEEVALVPAHEATHALGVVRVPLPTEVPDGGRVTVRFEVQAPAQAGVYTYAWALARGSAETLQQPTPPGEVTVQDSTDCTRPGPAARFRAQESPAPFIGVGETVRGRMTFANCGADTWRRDDGFALHSALADGSTPWGTARVELPRDVPFGAEVTFDVEGTAPATQGRYRWAWAVQRRGESLGPPSPEVPVTALRRASCGSTNTPSRFVSQRAPEVLDPGQSAEVDITFDNCGREVWDASHRINAAAPATDGRWGAGNLPLPLEVGPGFRMTVPFRITAPSDAGAYAYRWVVTRAGEDLPEASPLRDVRVRVIDTAGPCQASPVNGRVTSPYGYRVHPITGEWRLHTGIDFGAASGTHIHACRGGTVVRANWYGGYGNAIIVDHGGGMQTLYAHQSAFAVSAGQRVSAGQHIGYVGSTGNSTGPHLHFEVYINGRTVDPARGYL